MSTLPDQWIGVKADMGALKFLGDKLAKPLTNPNWENEKKLLVRNVKRTIASLRAFEKALTD